MAIFRVSKVSTGDVQGTHFEQFIDVKPRFFRKRGETLNVVFTLDLFGTRKTEHDQRVKRESREFFWTMSKG